MRVAANSRLKIGLLEVFIISIISIISNQKMYSLIMTCAYQTIALVTIFAQGSIIKTLPPREPIVMYRFVVENNILWYFF
ncbi:hypothetical protein DP148_26610 [Salmonella enterica subsp. enterica serovar Typhimurium]|nr:hypothetical protein DP148_26610 [Salmonella enterica subsp. enterica serovar Typhimurium]